MISCNTLHFLVCVVFSCIIDFVFSLKYLESCCRDDGGCIERISDERL